MSSGDPEITLRPAREGDAEDLARLSGELGYPIPPERAAARLRDVSGDADHALLVAETAGRVAGLVELRRVRMVMAWKQVEIVALVVGEESRGRGIGSRLLEEAERWAYDLRCGKVRVRSSATREGAHSLYRRRGYEPTRAETLFEKQLGTVRPKAAGFVPTSVASYRDRGPRRRIHALSIVRVAVAALLIANGTARIVTGGIGGFAGLLSSGHEPLAHAVAWAVTGVEVLGGIALAAGRFARPLSLWFAAELLAGLVLVEAGATWSVAGSARNGAEYSLLLAACLLAVAWGSPGRGVTQPR